MRDPVYYRRFDYDKSLLPNAHLASLEEGVTTIEEARERTGMTIGYPGWGLLYNLLLCHLKPDAHEIIIETGTNQGCTSIVLAQALKDSRSTGHLHTFELEDENADIAESNLQKAGLADLVTVHRGDSRQNVPAHLDGKSGIRFCFLDASHLFDDVKQEFEAVLPHLLDDALIVFDNTYRIARKGEDPRVNGFARRMTRDYGGNLINLEFVSWFTPGLAIWQKTPNL